MSGFVDVQSRHEVELKFLDITHELVGAGGNVYDMTSPMFTGTDASETTSDEVFCHGLSFRGCIFKYVDEDDDQGLIDRNFPGSIFLIADTQCRTPNNATIAEIFDFANAVPVSGWDSALYCRMDPTKRFLCLAREDYVMKLDNIIRNIDADLNWTTLTSGVGGTIGTGTSAGTTKIFQGGCYPFTFEHQFSKPLKLQYRLEDLDVPTGPMFTQGLRFYMVFVQQLRDGTLPGQTFLRGVSTMYYTEDLRDLGRAISINNSFPPFQMPLQVRDFYETDDEDGSSKRRLPQSGSFSKYRKL